MAWTKEDQKLCDDFCDICVKYWDGNNIEQDIRNIYVKDKKVALDILTTVLDRRQSQMLAAYFIIKELKRIDPPKGAKHFVPVGHLRFSLNKIRELNPEQISRTVVEFCGLWYGFIFGLDAICKLDRGLGHYWLGNAILEFTDGVLWKHRIEFESKNKLERKKKIEEFDDPATYGRVKVQKSVEIIFENKPELQYEIINQGISLLYNNKLIKEIAPTKD